MQIVINPDLEEIYKTNSSSLTPLSLIRRGDGGEVSTINTNCSKPYLINFELKQILNIKIDFIIERLPNWQYT